MTYKNWTTGDILEASDINGVSDQAINRFTNATARDAAITSPTQGQVVYLNDVGLMVYDGSAWTHTFRSFVLKDYGETVKAHGNTGTTETVDLEDGNVHTATLDNNCTLTFSNPPASGTAGSFTLILTQDGTGSRTVTWPASVDWAGATAPTLSTGASDVDVLTFLTTDGGTTWLGFLAGADMS